MDVLFTDDEMSKCCYKESKRTTKPGLNKDKVKLLEGMSEDCQAHCQNYVNYYHCYRNLNTKLSQNSVQGFQLNPL